MSSSSKKPVQSQSQALQKEPETKKESDVAEPEEEIRCYRFDSLALQYEQELLEERDADDFHDLLCSAVDSLEIFVFLLENIDPDVQVEGPTLRLLARELRRINHFVFRIGDAYSTVDLVEA